jgi:alpha,alpha-trehalase
MWSPVRRQWLDVHWPTRKPVDSPSAASNWLPLWAGCYSASQAKAATNSLRTSGLVQPGGIATTLTPSDEQWDWPNAWAPLQDMLIEGLERTQLREAHELALSVARRWTTSNLRAWRKTHFMFEKYSAVDHGYGGAGGEYAPQVGFGWSNGVALSLLARYGDDLAVATTHEESAA